jgi:hypothetical protein
MASVPRPAIAERLQPGTALAGLHPIGQALEVAPERHQARVDRDQRAHRRAQLGEGRRTHDGHHADLGRG